MAAIPATAQANSAAPAKLVYVSFNVKTCCHELVLQYGEKQKKGRNGCCGLVFFKVFS